MQKFLIGLLTGVVLAGLILVIVFVAFLRFREKPPAIADNSVLVLHLEGDIPERAPVEYPIPLLGDSSRPTVANVWMLLRKAAADKHIKAVLLQLRSLSIGWAKAQEIRADLEIFKKSGKPLYAWLSAPGGREYYVASIADRIYLGPQDWLNLKGLRAELMYFQQTLSKLGVQVQIVHAGKYKDFGDMFTRNSMSPETREVLNSVLDETFEQMLQAIASGRKKSPDQVRAILNQGPFLAREAQAQGLVDALRYEDQIMGELKSHLKLQDMKTVAVRTYMRVAPSSLGLDGKQRIALVIGEGSITRGQAGDDGISDSNITPEGFNKLLRRVANDSALRGVIVRIDSPGGEVTASDEIWREMNLLSKKKPLVISMSDVAASGGYYMAMSGDPIIAYPGTITGSIGVVYGKANLQGLYNKLGITKDTLTRGRFADIDSDYKALGSEELAKLRHGIDVTYEDFVKRVAESRKRKYQEIHEVAQGRVWLGTQAKAQGLVDQLGGLDRAIELVKEKAKIPTGEKVTVITYPARRTIFDVLLRQAAEDPLESRLAKWLRGWEAKAWLTGGYLRLMPFAIDVR